MKIEKWLEDVFPTLHKDVEMYKGMTFRELSIVLAAGNDSLVAHLLRQRLVDDEKEVAAMFKPHFPLGDSSNRHTMAYLVGLLDKRALEIMRTTNKIRNIFAHTVNAQVTDPAIQSHLETLHGLLRGLVDFHASDTVPGRKLADAVMRLFVSTSSPMREWTILFLSNALNQSEINGHLPKMERVTLTYSTARAIIEREEAEVRSARRTPPTSPQ